VTKALFDLGWSGYQLESGRGFSFLRDEPLIMTYASEPKGALTAETIVNSWQEESIVSILSGWGEERYARRIAHAISHARRKKRITTTTELVDVIRSAVPRAYAHGRLHPATKTFQALRIAVNDEMGALTEGLTACWQRLLPGGRIAVITFHSIEDRAVKRLFLEWSQSGEGERITRSPIVPSRKEVRANPRSRSAKLRVIRKIS
jgi:16S rRNA (cytosine1402-N4)-methyltransferase